MVQVPPELLAERRRVGADRWDEVWDGVLHMVPSPDLEHQGLEGALETWLRNRWTAVSGGRVYHQVNVARPGLDDWRRDFRVPDVVLVTPERVHLGQDTHFAGGPDVVVEIRSPDDETCEKILFYAQIGVREIWVIDRDTRAVEVIELGVTDSTRRAPGADGWVRSALGIELRTEAGRRLALKLRGEDASLGHVP